MAGVYYGFRKYRKGALLIFVAVLSHWVLDFVSHRPDMPLAPGAHDYYGLGLYNSRIGMLVVEGMMWLGGIVLYERAKQSRKRAGAWTLYVGVLILTSLWVASLSGAPPGVSMTKMGIIDLIFLAIVVGWAYLVDKLRMSAAEASAQPFVGRAASVK